MKSLLPLLLICLSCSQSPKKVSDPGIKSAQKDSIHSKSYIDTSARTIESRYQCPDGFERIAADSLSYAAFLRSLKLMPFSHPVMTYDGKLRQPQWVSCGVLDQDIDPQNLQQCADAVMRLRGEYLFSIKAFDKISFNFLSDGRPRPFTQYTTERSYASFRKYMLYIFDRANTASLKQQLQSVASIADIQPGDVLIQSGNPHGHAVNVMDVIRNSDGKTYFLLAQSYMPAQETHILINPNFPEISPWYEAKEGKIVTPEWEFNSTDLRRFP
ncbi:MAG: hypothetical protein RIT43_224 [Bacteroidota bacterium]|jgi:hypothetical protein